jgi:hypothetical protein
MGSGQRALERSSPGEGQRGVALRELRQALLVEAARVVEQPVPKLADVAGAQWNAGEERDERRLEGVGQHDRLVVAFFRQLAPQPAPLAEPQVAVLERAEDRPPHFGHALEQGKGPARGQHVDL